MFGFKTLGITTLVVALLTGISVWKYQGYKYNVKITQLELQHSQEQTKAQAELAKANANVLIQERKNDAITKQMETDRLAKQKRIDALLANNADLVRKLGGMYLPGSCQASTGTSSSPSSESTPATSSCRLSDEVSVYLLGEMHRADEAAESAAECYAYAREVNKQRERMQKEQEQK